jgi:ornithine cyclodeaminase/alanine dehydrogenase-like protein (mu-crystallin family)
MALVLREKDVRSLLSIHDALIVLEDAFTAQAQGTAINTPRTRLMLPHGVLNMLAAAAPTLGVLGYKTYTAFREGVRFVVLLFSAQNGQLLAIIEADWLGAIRTGATSALATKYMARPDARAVGLIGAGKQAMTQLMGVCAVCPISSVYVYSRNFQRCELFCQEMMHILDIEVLPVAHAQDAVEGADIVITATSSGAPVLFGEWLTPGCHINAIGSNWAKRRELDSTVLQQCSLIVTDSLEQARIEAGDFILSEQEQSGFDWLQVHELSEVIGGRRPVRVAPDEITLYKGLGIALEDIATAAHVYNLACQHGIGEQLELLC